MGDENSKSFSNEDVINAIEENKKLISKLNRKVRLLDTKTRNQDRILESYKNLFTYLYVHHDIKPKGTLKDMQDLCLELLRFMDNVCKKYNIDYWLDFGTLLGSVRHEGFIPWDDDVDVGILKKDFDKFLKVFKKEVEDNGLDEFITILEKKKYDNSVTGFVQILYFKSPLVNNMLAGIDLLPYEYLKDDENLPIEELKAKISNKIIEMRDEFIEKEYFKKYPEEAHRKFNENLNVVDHEAEYIIASAVNLNPRIIKLYKTKDFFPLQKVKFEQYYFPSANHDKDYLKAVFGDDYMELPKIVSFHTRMQTVMKKDVDDLHELYRGEILRLRKINEKWM